MTVVTETGEIVVHADRAGVDRRDAVLGVQSKPGGNTFDPVRGVRLEQVVVERACEERVVDAEERVGHRVILHEQRLAQRLARGGIHFLRVFMNSTSALRT